MISKPPISKSLFTAAFLILCVARINLAGVTDELTADVIVAGGSTAAMAAAFSAAESGANTILIEPTDWIGGQLTSSGVPPIDEAWHQIKDPATGKFELDVAKIARDPRNMTPAFRDILQKIGNPGRGWVSRYCYPPKIILDGHLQPWEKSLNHRLTVLRNTVIKKVEVSGRRITSINVIERTPRSPGNGGYDRLPSQDIPDWYDPQPSDRFDKRVRKISLHRNSVLIEATEWGEVLALSGKAYQQGIDTNERSNDQCGQSTVFGFVQRLNPATTEDTAPVVRLTNPTSLGLGKYEGRDDAWEKIWTYRRLAGKGDGPTSGDLSLQNWGYEPAKRNGGNDYPFGYLFLAKQETAASIDDWQGGVNLAVMQAAETRAFAWHHWLKTNAPPEIDGDRITMAFDILGTDHGLCKLPYIRDTRRSIGLDDFVLQLEDLIADVANPQNIKTGTVFPDRVAIGAYPADVHFLTNCDYPKHIQEHRDTKPFHIPFRALTHRDFENVLVAGKTMAQSFTANSATRLHPIEWSSGTAAGVIAEWMSKNEKSSREAYQSIKPLQALIKHKTPIDWSW